MEPGQVGSSRLEIYILIRLRNSSSHVHIDSFLLLNPTCILFCQIIHDNGQQRTDGCILGESRHFVLALIVFTYHDVCSS